MGNNSLSEQLCNFGFYAKEMGLAKDRYSKVILNYSLYNYNIW